MRRGASFASSCLSVDSLAGLAVVGTAAASAIGMAAVCLLLSTYGFVPATVEPVETAMRRHLTARLTYVVVAVCLATNALCAFAFVAESRTADACATAPGGRK